MTQRVAWRHASPEDLLLVMEKAQPEQRSQLEAPFPPFAAASPEEVAHLARTFLLHDEPEAFLGVLPFWPGVARAIALISSKAVEEAPIALTRGARRLIREAIDTLQLRRLEVTVDARHGAAVRWAGALGFECEGMMRRYGTDGADHWLFAKVMP